MERLSKVYEQYCDVLKEELIPAMGCTEPIAIAYAAAKARAVLGGRPERIVIQVSGNIIKNVKSVIVPHTGGLRGIAAAAAAGIIAGNEDKELEVISDVTTEEIEQMQIYLKSATFEICCAKSEHIFDIGIRLYRNDHESYVRITDAHTNIVRIEKDNQVLFEKETVTMSTVKGPDRSFITVEGIIDFANSVVLEDVEDVLNRQIEYNMAISEEGLRNSYGANIGKVILNHCGDAVAIKAKAAAAAGSDARMNGCEMPVVINSGSGNQGMTASIPVIVYAREKGFQTEQLLRALIVSNLVTIHLKTGVGRLSAYCGAVSAGCGCGAGIAYLEGGKYQEVAHTIVNSLAIVSGMVCDGAKASCAAKIAASVDAGILGYYMYQDGQEFYDGDGLVIKGVENTICNFGKLASVGMCNTDKEIIKLMVGEE